MMKQKLLISLMLAMTLAWGGNVWGQTYLIQEGFSTTSVPTNWTENSMYYNTTANHGTLSGANGAGFNATNDWLYTPSVSTAGTLTFWIKGSSSPSNIGITIQKSTDASNWSDIVVYAKGRFSTTWENISININDASSTIYIRFFIHDRSGNSLYVDDIELTNYSPSAPVITITPTSISGFSYIEGNGPSSEQSFTAAGSNLTSDITITPPTDYEISTGTGGSFSAANPITLTQSSGTVNETTIYVRLKSGLSAGDYNSEAITASSTGATSQEVSCSGTVYALEPSNHVISFAASANGSATINLSWTENDGAVVPAGYLILANTGSVVDPVDGTDPADDTDLTDGSGNVEVAHGTTTYSFTHCSSSTTYNFKIYPYTNSGSNIDFKADGTVPSDNATTGAPAIAPTAGVVFISEVSDSPSDFSSEYIEIYNASNNEIDLSSAKIIRYPSAGGTAEYIWDFSTDGSGNITIPANGLLIVARGATNAEFEIEWGSLPSGVFYNEGNTNLYFGNGRSWALKDGGTADTDDGTTIDATNQGVAASGFRDYQYPRSTWNNDSRASATPGVVDNNENPATYFWDTGAGTSDWETVTNWDPNFVPGELINVLIPAGATNYPTISAAAACNDITIESGASLIGAENLTVNGTATMQQTIDAYTSNADGWHLLSSPVATFNISGTSVEPGANDDFYRWDEATYTWKNYKNGDPTQMVSGTGYLVAYQATGTKDFTGSFNTSDIPLTNLTITTVSGEEGWHLLGNPFQSALHWNESSNWNLTGLGAGAKILNSGGTYTDITSGGANQYIPANQGFFVQATSATNSITLPLAERIHNSTAWYKDQIPSLMTIKADNGQFYAETTIQVMDNATDLYDETLDMHFWWGMYGAPALYSEADDQLLSTNRIAPIDGHKAVQLAFEAFSNDDFTLSFNGAPSFEMQVLLEDQELEKFIDLAETSQYTFQANANELTHRFVVHFYGTTSVTQETQNNARMFSTGSQVVILSNEGIHNGSLTVYNLLGQPMAVHQVDQGSVASYAVNASRGWYIAVLTTAEGTTRTKVFIQ